MCRNSVTSALGHIRDTLYGLEGGIEHERDLF